MATIFERGTPETIELFNFMKKYENVREIKVKRTNLGKDKKPGIDITVTYDDDEKAIRCEDAD